MALMTPHITVLQQIAVPPSPLETPQITARSEGIFKINWFNFRDHVRRAQTDNQSGDMISEMTICCRGPRNTDWTHFHVSKGVILSGSVDFREEILARPDNRPIFMWNMPAKVMLQVLSYLHTGTLMAPMEDMERFMLAKHQLRVGAVFGNEYSYQLIRIINPNSRDPMVTVGLHSPWVTQEYSSGVLFDDMKENKNCAAECVAGQCIHRRRLGNPSIRVSLRNCMKITRTPVQGNEQGMPAPQGSLSTGMVEDQRRRVVDLDHDYCGTAVSFTGEAGHRCDFCGRRFINNAELHQHHITIHFLRV